MQGRFGIAACLHAGAGADCPALRRCDARVVRLLHRGYLIAVLAASVAYIVWLYSVWQSATYPGRDFNSLERLLTQPRVLCLYLWQIVVPLPEHMPFHYDWVQPSRSLLHPWTTLPAIGVDPGPAWPPHGACAHATPCSRWAYSSFSARTSSPAMPSAWNWPTNTVTISR